MHGVICGAQRHGFVVLTLENFDLCAGAEAKIFQKIEEPFILLIDAQNFCGFVGAKFGKKDAALLAELGDATIDGDAVRTGLRLPKRLSCNASTSGEMACSMRSASAWALAQERPLRHQLAEMPIAGHALNGGSDCRGRNVEFFGEPGADGDLLFLEHFPNGFEVIFLRDAGFIAAQ